MLHEDEQPAETPSASEGQVDDMGDSFGLTPDETQGENTDVNPSSADPSDAEQNQGVKQETDPTPGEEDVNNEPKTLLEAVSSAIKGKEEGEPGEDTSSQKADESKDPNQADTQNEDESLSDEEKELKDLDGKPVPYVRFKEVLTEKNEFKPKVNDLTQQVQTLQPQAQAFENFRGYMQEKNVSGDDAVRALDIVGLINNDPEKAYIELMQITEDLGVGLGKALPRDIQQMVDSGEVSETAAKELANHRATARTSQTALQQTEVREQQRQQENVAQTQAQIKSSVNAWDADKLAKDPTYKGQKRKLTQTYITSYVAKNGKPQTPQQYLQVADWAYQEANKTIGEFKPKRPAKKPGPASSGSSTQSVAEPKTMAEAVRLGLSKSQ